MLILFQKVVRLAAAENDVIEGLERGDIVVLTRSIIMGGDAWGMNSSASIIGNFNKIVVSPKSALFSEFSGSIQDLVLEISPVSASNVVFAQTVKDAEFWNVNVTIVEPLAEKAIFAQYVNFSTFNAFFLTFSSPTTGGFTEFSIIQSTLEFCKIDGLLAAEVSKSTAERSVFDELPLSDKLGEINLSSCFCVQQHSNCTKLTANATFEQQEAGSSFRTEYRFELGNLGVVFGIRRKQCTGQILFRNLCLPDNCGVLQQNLCNQRGICDDFSCSCENGYDGSPQCAQSVSDTGRLFTILFIITIVLFAAAVVAIILLAIKLKKQPRASNRLIKLSDTKECVFSEVAQPSENRTEGREDLDEHSILEPDHDLLEAAQRPPKGPKPLGASIQIRSQKKAATELI